MSGSTQDEPTSFSRKQSRVGPLKDGRKSSFGGANLPLCPKSGNVDYSASGPCRKRKSRPKAGRRDSSRRARRKSGFRVPLKREDGNMESQVVEYNCEFPNRVVVRMEYLMQSTKVRLNDKHYMDDFYTKLIDEERRVLAKATKAREKAELNRMKKLIIDGIYYDIPPELSYLRRHPVFRVNKMLARLQTYEHTLALVKMDEAEEVTPVEPYEFDGNTFFKHLHDVGEVWMPPYFKDYEKEKLEGKIYRARLRLLMKRKEQEADDRAMRMIAEMTNYNTEEEEEPKRQVPRTTLMWDDQAQLPQEEEEKKEDKSKSKKESRNSAVRIMLEKQMKEQESEDQMLSNALHMQTTSKPLSSAAIAASRIQAKSRQEIVVLQEKIRQSKELQEKRDAALDARRHELDEKYVDTFDYNYQRILTHNRERQKQRKVEEIFQRDDWEQKHLVKDSKGDLKLTKSDKKLKPYEELFEKKEADSRYELTGNPEKDTFNKLRAFFEIPREHPFRHYKEYDDEIVADINLYDEGMEMMEYANEIVQMFRREELATKEYLANLKEKVYEKEEEKRKKSSIKQARKSSNEQQKRRSSAKSNASNEAPRRQTERKSAPTNEKGRTSVTSEREKRGSANSERERRRSSANSEKGRKSTPTGEPGRAVGSIKGRTSFDIQDE